MDSKQSTESEFKWVWIQLNVKIVMKIFLD